MREITKPERKFAFPALQPDMQNRKLQFPYGNYKSLYDKSLFLCGFSKFCTGIHFSSAAIWHAEQEIAFPVRQKQIPVLEFGFSALQSKKLTRKWLFPYRKLKGCTGNRISRAGKRIPV
jgi:hypothetical protein